MDRPLRIEFDGAFYQVMAKVHKEDIEINDLEIPELKVIKQLSAEEIKKNKSLFSCFEKRIRNDRRKDI